MNFLKRLFGSEEETPEEKKKATEARQFDVLKYDGVAALRAGRSDYAIKCFEHALQLQDDLEIHDHLSVAYTHQNELPKACDELEKLALAQPENMAIWVRMARILYMMEDYERMSEACEKAKGIEPGNPEVAYLHAQALHGTGENETAVSLLTDAIAQEPKLGAAYLLRGRILMETQHLEEADSDADWLLEHTESDEDALLLKARIAREKGDDENAVVWYSKVIDANPFCAAAFRERGELHKKLGKDALAADDLNTAAELEPENADGKEGNPIAEDIEQKTKEAYKSINPLGL